MQYEPVQLGDRWYWNRLLPGAERRNHEDLPFPLYDTLPNPGGFTVGYPTREAAKAALLEAVGALRALTDQF